MADSTLAGTGFQTFFAGSKAVDKSGQPLRLYHGTVNDFSVFDRSRSNIDGYFGAGFYFSSAAADVGVNYASVDGPDFRARVASEVESLLGDSETDADLGFDDLMIQVQARRAQNQGTTMPVYLAIKNPFVIGSTKDTYLDYSDGFDGQGEFGVKSGRLQQFIEALKWVMEGYNAEREFDEMLEALQEDELIEAPGIHGTELLDAIKRIMAPDILNFDGEARSAILDYTRSAGAEVRVAWDRVQELIEAAGYDGVIYENTGHDEGEDGSDSYIVFEPEQIKSAFGNNGNFDVANPDIRFSMVDVNADDVESGTEAPRP